MAHLVLSVEQSNISVINFSNKSVESIQRLQTSAEAHYTMHLTVGSLHHSS